MESRELLIIDDEETIRKALAAFFSDRGFTVFTAADGESGLELLRSMPGIGAVLTDIRLPKADGLEVLRRTKEHNPSTQVILMTAYSDKNLAIQALRLGADDYLEKPFSLETAAEIIERGLHRQRVEDLSRRWQQFLEHLPLGLVWCSPDGIVEGTTADADALLNFKSDEMIGTALWKLPGLEKTQGLFLAEQSVATPESVEINKGGNVLVIQPMDAAVADNVPRFLVVTNVTEEKALQRELASLSGDLESRVAERTRSLRSELEFSQRLLDTAGVLVAVLDHDGKLVRLNKFAEELTRFSREEAQRVITSFIQHPESPLSVIFDPDSSVEISGMIADLPTRDGTKRIVSWSTRDLPSHAGEGAKLIIGIDVTEQKLLEAKLQNYNLQLENMVESRSLELRQKNAQLIHSARLASLGEIAAGIAHEMKQPLNVISITADLIKLLHRNRTLTDDLLLSNLEKIRYTVDRMATTINHLRGFLHIDSANFTDVRVADAVNGALSILGAQIRLDDIDIITEIPDDLPVVHGELNQIEQVLVNLMQNARDSIVGKAQHKPAGRKTRAAAKRIVIRAGVRSQGRELFVEVQDSGAGISDEARPRVFEPFFTTKEADRGTGLGLSISMNIVQSHGGAMELESVPGKGSTFRAVFPLNASA
jgi:PAS domain S-box-containing protein